MKSATCIGKSKVTDQHCSYCQADQCLCFYNTNSTIPLLSNSKISSWECTSWFLSDMVGNQNCWFSHARDLFRYYNSRFDTAKTINASYPADLNRTDWYDYVTDQANRLAKVSTLLARYLYREATGNDTDVMTADETTVSSLRVKKPQQFWVSDQVQHKLACTAPEADQ